MDWALKAGVRGAVPSGEAPAQMMGQALPKVLMPASTPQGTPQFATKQ